MRRVEEIDNDIEFINKQMKILRAKREVLYNEKSERLFSEFCEKYSVKKGDIVELNDRHRTQVQVVGKSSTWFDWIVCRKLKKNGEPSLNTTTFSDLKFVGCKVIRHIDE